MGAREVRAPLASITQAAKEGSLHMTDSFDRIMSGLGSALAFAEGNPPDGTRVHVPATLDVAAIRERTGLAQPAFAATIGVKVGTLRNWEQKRREPEGPARVLLALVDKRPQIVTELLGQAA